ncbi:FAD-dependent monooxygenase [Actinomadura rubrisoli]|uniref:FAD-binding protein n=1 Tax=Actinomadura rubrisoli TaxID=2530368 RepID=A0A4R5C1V2_9ACTN|nr:FAD-dependent monooxygenase [Actinomadura rubrisoli]TDD92499.1 FAD-binding protein [Actinomadura rubrisoli]
MTSVPGADEPGDVLVVGAGPTGLMAACELLRRGVRVRLIDRAPAASPFPKALLLWPRSLDLLADLGALGAAREAGLQINAFDYYSAGRPLATFDFPGDLAPLCLPQSETERVLTGALHALGGTIERGVRLLAFDGLDYSGEVTATESVTSILEHPADGRVERVRHRFVIGADGAGSAVRAQMGTAFTGATYENAFALVDAHIEGELPPDRALYYQSPAGALVVVALPKGVYRFFSSLPPGQRVSVPLLQRIVDEQGPSGVKLVDPVWEAVFRVHRRHAADFQLGRVFIAGDAAHVHSPAGGQGLNTGLQDAHNLAWKIAAVLHGEAPPGLLSTYEPERKAVARRVVRDTDIQTRGWMLKHPLQVAARDTAFRLLDRSGVMARHYVPVMAGRRLAYPQARAGQEPSERSGCRLARGCLPGGGLRIGGVFPREDAATEPAGWTLVAVSRGDSAWRGALEEVVAPWPQVHLDERSGARAWACARPSYFLVRPDGHLAAHGHEGDLDRLRAELCATLAGTDAHASYQNQTP